MPVKKKANAQKVAEKLRERASALGLSPDSDANTVKRAENAKAKAEKDAKDANQKKDDGLKKQNLPTSLALIKRIKTCKCKEDIEAIEPDVVKAYGENVPDEINSIADAKMKEFVEAELNKEKGIVKTLKWEKVTIEEKDEAEKNCKLRGWNPRTQEALIG